MKEAQAYASIADKMSGLPDKVMDVMPSFCAERTEKMHPDWIQPAAGIGRGHGGGGFASDHGDRARCRQPVQNELAPA